MQKRVKLLKQNMLQAKPNVSADWVVLAKQAYAQYAGESSPVFRAHVFAYVLDHMELSIFPEELIVAVRPPSSAAYRSIRNICRPNG